MQQYIRKKHSAVSVITGVIMTVIVFIIISLIMTAICYLTNDPASLLGICSIASMLASGAICGLMLSLMKNHFGFAIAAICTAICTAIYLIIAAIVSGGIHGFQLMNAACYAGTSLLGAFIGRREKRSRRISRKF